MLREFAALKKRWGISIQALIQRAYDLGYVDSDRRESLYKQIGARGWRISEPVVVHPEQPSLMRAMLARRYGEPPAVLQASEGLGIHPVLMRSLAPENAANPAPKKSANVISLGERRQRVARLEAL
jgi:hypothetical protein